MSNFSTAYPTVTAEVNSLKQAIDQGCRQGIAGLLAAFFADYTHVKSVSWQQTVDPTALAIAIGNMSIEYSLKPVADDAQLLADMGSLNNFLSSIQYHLYWAYGSNVTVQFDRQGHTVTAL